MITANPVRQRRRSSQAGEHVKHRRTRSGCFTCRSRRVKCDEGHPTCERCRKGGRDCAYPDPSPSSKSSGAGSSKSGQTSSQASPDSSTDDEYEDEDDIERLESIPDEDGAILDASQIGTSPNDGARLPSTTQAFGQIKSQSHRSFEIPSLLQDKSISRSPSTEGSLGYSAQLSIANQRSRPSHSSLGTDRTKRDWSNLPQDLQFYLHYFCKNVTHHHYSLKNDAKNFLHTSFLDAALHNDALLHAVVGFSAFQRTLHSPEGKIQDFLQYYNRAVTILLKSLIRGERRTMGTLLAILQLATIEENLGDWVNLLGHQKAAYTILTYLFTPQTIVQTEFTRVVLGWYCRFDVFAGLMGGFETVLSREWFSFPTEYYSHRIKDEPDNLSWKVEEAIASLKLIAMDMTTLFAKIGKGEISTERFKAENETLEKRIHGWRMNMDPALQDPKYRVEDFTGARPRDADDIVDPYKPGIIFQGALWSINVCMLDWYSLDLIRQYQTAQILQTQPNRELALSAYAACQMFEAVEYWPGSPKGSVLACQSCLGIASMVLPRDTRHMMWCRKKFAIVESNGYIYPLTFRTKMSEMFQDPSCMQWWLPNDENFPSIIRSIRNFVDERTSSATDDSTKDLRDMKAIFASLNLENDRPPTSSSQATTPISQFLVDSSTDWPQSLTREAFDTRIEGHNLQQPAPFGSLSHGGSQQPWGTAPGAENFERHMPDNYRPS